MAKESKHVIAFKESHLNSGEEIIAWCNCDGGSALNVKNGSLIVTRDRVAFYRKGFASEDFESINVADISSLEHTLKVVNHRLTIHGVNNKISIKTAEQKNAFRRLIDCIEFVRKPDLLSDPRNSSKYDKPEFKAWAEMTGKSKAKFVFGCAGFILFLSVVLISLFEPDSDASDNSLNTAVTKSSCEYANIELSGHNLLMSERAFGGALDFHLEKFIDIYKQSKPSNYHKFASFKVHDNSAYDQNSERVSCFWSKFGRPMDQRHEKLMDVVRLFVDLNLLSIDMQSNLRAYSPEKNSAINNKIEKISAVSSAYNNYHPIKNESKEDLTKRLSK